MVQYLPKIIKFGLYITLFLPMVHLSYTFFPDHGKILFFQMIVELLVVLWVIWQLYESKVIRQEKKVFFKKNNILDFFLLLFLLVLVATSFFGVNFENSFWGNQARSNGVFTWLHFGAWYFLLKFSFKEKKEWLKLLVISIVVGLVVTLTAIFQNSLPISWRGDAGARLSGILGNPAYLAAYLIPVLGITLFFAIGIFKKIGYKWQKILVILLLLVFFWVLLSTKIRGGFLGMTTGTLAGLIIMVVFLKKRIRLFLVGLIIFLFVFSGVLIIYSTKNGLPKPLDRFDNYFNVNNYLTGTGKTRLMAWNIALKGIKERPIQGWGMGNYDIAFNKYYNPEFLKFGFKETVWDKPHNWLLEIVYSTGILGFFSYAGILACAFWGIFKTHFFTSEKAVLVGTLVAYIVQSMFLFETSNSLLMFFLILAFIYSQIVKDHNELKIVRDQKILSNRALILGSYLIVALFIFYKYNVLPLKSAYYLKQSTSIDTMEEWANYAKQSLSLPVFFNGETAVFLSEDFVGRSKQGISVNDPKVVDVAKLVIQTLEQNAIKYPDNVAYPVWAGQMYLVLGEQVDVLYYDNAKNNLQKAKNIAPNKQEILFLLGRLYLLEKKTGEAISVLEQAVSLNPEVNQGHWFLGLAFVASEDLEQGLNEIEEAKRLGYSPSRQELLYVTDLYAQAKNYDMVIETYKNLIEDEPGNIDWYIKLAVAYAMDGRKIEALELARIIEKASPELKSKVDAFIKEYNLE